MGKFQKFWDDVLDEDVDIKVNKKDKKGKKRSKIKIYLKNITIDESIDGDDINYELETID